MLSADVLLHATWETLKISCPAVVRARRGTLTPGDCDTALRSWARRLVDFAEIELEVRGQEHLTPGQPYVVVSNHQSLYDVPVLYVALPLSLRMVAKKELFRTPLWGEAMRVAGFVPIDRKDREAAYRALEEAGRGLRESGISLYLAPEGTRTSDGSVGPFKRGAFELARRAGLPILPVSIDGTREVLPKNGTEVKRKRRVTVTILSPVSAPKESEVDDLRQELRSRIARVVGEPAPRASGPQNTMPA